MKEEFLEKQTYWSYWVNEFNRRINLGIEVLFATLIVYKSGFYSITRKPCQPEGGDFNDQVLFMYVRVRSSVFGEFVRPVLYVFTENETFYAEKMRPLHAHISHIIHVRYGGGMGGGGNSAGAWLLNVLKDLHCELFITDGHHHWQNGDDFALSLCPEIPREVNVELKRIRQIHEMRWSSHGHVSWNLVA